MKSVLSSEFSNAPAGLEQYSIYRPVTTNWLRRAGMIVLALMLVTTGSYIRWRGVDDQNAVDWLVLVQIGLSLAGACLGLLLIQKHPLGGFGARVLAAYLVAVITSSFVSSYAVLVAGYWVLLAGTSVLCMGLVSSSSTEASLREVENFIFASLSFMLLKDTLIDVFYFRPMVDVMEDMGVELYRFGMGSSSSNLMGLLAAVAFWMSFKTPTEKRAGKMWRFTWRGLFGAVLLLTRARIALAALVGAGVIRWWFVHRHSRNIRANNLLVAMPCLAASLVLLAAIGWSWGFSLIADTVEFVSRGEDSSTLLSVTGRTDLWPYALKKIFEGPVSIVFGHGYGASKLVLNDSNATVSFFAYHAHNTFLEVLLGTGVLGLLPFILLVVYSLTWLARFSLLVQSFSLEFTLRAVTVVTAILSSTMTESELAIKTGPILIVFIFYVLALDRRAAFQRVSQLPSRP